MQHSSTAEVRDESFVPRHRRSLAWFSSIGLALVGVFIIGASETRAQCEPGLDCNGNGVLDLCDIAFGVSDDCDLDGIPDECVIALDPSLDCNLDGILDACTPVLDALLTSTIGFAGDGGAAVATDGETTLVGIPADDTGGLAAGAVVVHRRTGTRWFEETVLFAVDAHAGSRFGTAVAVDGEWIAVGAPGANLGPTAGAGAVYVYRRTGGAWTLHTKLTLAGAQVDDGYGTAVDLSGSILVAGAPQLAPGLAGGRATIHFFNGLQWTLVLEPAPPALEVGAALGSAVATDGALVAIGAPREQGALAASSGAVYTYRNIVSLWAAGPRLISQAEQAGEQFGRAIAIADGRIVIGSPGRDTGAGGVSIFREVGLSFAPEAQLSSPSALPSEFGHAIDAVNTTVLIGEPRVEGDLGIVHLFDRIGTTWSLRESRAPVLNQPGDRFGSAVGLANRTAVVGAVGRPGAYSLWVDLPTDCDGDGLEDLCAIADGLVLDCDLDGVPDNCQITDGTGADCDLDGVLDACELASGTGFDCNGNGRLDSCDIVAGAGDCDGNGVPDECELDCDESGTPDACDIAAGLAEDCDGDAAIDSCAIAAGLSEDCNGNGVPDSCDLAGGTSHDCDADGTLDDCAIAAGLVADCNGNGVPDSCDFTAGTSTDCNFTGIPDECDIASGLSSDCDANGNPDECDFVNGAADCNANGILDTCDIAAGTSQDCDADAVPDGCQLAAGALDCNGNGILDPCDVAAGIIVDATPPAIAGVPADLSVGNDSGACGAVVTWATPAITDDCQLVSVTRSHDPGAFFPVGATTVTYAAVDLYGNESTESFTVTVTDVEAPTTSGAPNDVVLEAEIGSCGANFSFALPSAADNCTVASVVPSISSGSFFPVGTTAVTIVTSDVAGNAMTDSFTVTVVDVRAPTLLSVPTELTVAADPGVCGAVVTFDAPTAIDACGAVEVSTSASSGDFFPVGESTVEIFAADAAGNVQTATFSVTVDDLGAPAIIGLPASVTLAADPGACSALFAWPEVTANDDCPGVTLTLSHASGSSFPVGTTTVTATATDVAGNATTQSFTVMVDDAEAPSISGVPADLEISTDPGACTATVTWPVPLVSDRCPGVTTTVSPPSGTAFEIGTTTVTIVAVDAAGNTSEASFTVSVTDDTAPTLSTIPDGFLLSTDLGSCGAVVTWDPIVADDACGVASFTTSHTSGTSFPVGTTVVSIAAIDPSGNTTTASFAIEVEDTTAPLIIGGPEDIAVENVPGECGAMVTWSAPEVTDPCGVASVSIDATSGDFFPVGSTLVTIVASDLAGNTSVHSFTVIVADVEAPILVGVPAPITAPSDPGGCGAVVTWSAPSALEACPGVVIATSHLEGIEFPVGVTDVVFSATDASGNTSTATTTITILDTTAPVLTGVPDDAVLSVDAGTCGAVFAWSPIEASDGCGVVLVESSHVSGAVFPVGETTVVVDFADAAQNRASAVFTVTVIDDEPPTLGPVPTDVALITDPLSCTVVVGLPARTATDNCGVASVSASHASDTAFPLGTTVVTYTAIDFAGNIAEQSFTISVTDETAPTITPSGPISVAVDPVPCVAFVTVPPPALIEGCGSATLVNDVTGTDDASAEYPAGDTLITWTATDAVGNTSSATQWVTVGGSGADCDANGVPDACDIGAGLQSDCNGNGTPDSCEIDANPALDVDVDGVLDACQAIFLRGDGNADMQIDLADGIAVLRHLFFADIEVACLPSLDANDDGLIHLSDAIFIFSYLLDEGALPPPPFDGCGVDPTPDVGLECAGSSCP